MRDFLQDLLYSFRQFRKNPGFALTAIVSLALGIGATTAVFSVIYAVIFDPYPYVDTDRMVHLVVTCSKGCDERWIDLTGPQIQELRKAKTVEAVAAQDDWNLTTTGKDVPEDVSAIYFTGTGLNQLGVPPLLGRNIQPSDAPEGADPQPVAVLGYQFWRRHYGSDPKVIGQTIELVHKPYTIIGVAQPRMAWGDGDVYLPLKLSSDQAHAYYPLIKLKPGVTHAMVNAEFQSLLNQFAQQTPTHFPDGGFKVNVQGLNDNFIKRIGGTLSLLFIAVGMLLAIGCGNVSILLLARGTVRQHELAVRAAVGASRSRIVRQLLTESLLLALTGAVVGVMLAYRAVSLIAAWLPQFSFPHEAAIKINVPVLCFSVGLALLTAILFGLAPALQMSRPDVSQVMQASSKKTTGTVRGKRMYNTLVSAQIALTLLLLAAAGAALEGFLRLQHTNLGYNPHNVMSVGIPVHENTYTTWEARAQYFKQLREHIASIPQVTVAGISTNATPPDNGWQSKFDILGKPSGEEQEGRINFVSPEYFSVLEIPLLEGRLWSQSEVERGALFAVVNQSLARRYFPNNDAIGHSVKLPNLRTEGTIRLAAPGADGWLQIIGVVGDARDDGLRKPVRDAIYVPYTLGMVPWTQVLVRSSVDPLTLLHAAREQVRQVDPDQQVIRNVQDLDHWVQQTPEWATQHLIAWLFAAFALLALALAAVGLYSVVSYVVAQRTNEFGIRMALGAQRQDVLRLVLISTATSVGTGLLVGVILSLALARAVAHWAEGNARDPLVLLGVTMVMAIVAGIACLVPARRASTVDPMSALRYE